MTEKNLNVAYQIINDYEQYGTIEDFKMARGQALINEDLEGIEDE